jgi:hypothetical protein
VSDAGSIAISGGTEKQSSCSSNIGSPPHTHMGVSLCNKKHTVAASSCGSGGGERVSCGEGVDPAAVLPQGVPSPLGVETATVEPRGMTAEEASTLRRNSHRGR